MGLVHVEGPMEDASNLGHQELCRGPPQAWKLLLFLLGEGSWGLDWVLPEAFP